MPRTVKVDLLGSTLTEGREARFDRAVRRAIVRGLQNDPATGTTENDVHLKEAINAVLAEVGEYHHLDTDLPIERIQAVKFGDTSAFVRIIYSRRTGRFDDDVPQNIATITTALETTHLYRASTDSSGEAAFDQFNLPNGEIWKTPDDRRDDDNFIPHERMYKRPVRRIWVRLILRQYPVGQVDRLVGTVNLNPLIFGGVNMPAFTTRFDGYTVRVFVSDDETFFDTQYVFTWLPEGHYHHKPIKRSGADWDTVQELEYKAAHWGGVFSPP